jgi:hypothetical protein
MENLLFLIPAAVALVIYKANTWNANPSLFAAQKRERDRAASFVDVLTRHFDALDTDKIGLITGASALRAVEGLGCSEADKALLRAALCHIGARVFTAENPWYLATSPAEYTFTPIGHVVGRHKEYAASVTGHPYGGVVVPYEIWVDDYAISREDLASYIDRVKQRQTLPSV